MKKNRFEDWVRFELDNTPVFIRPDTPDWMVPSSTGDRLLQNVIEYGEMAIIGDRRYHAKASGGTDFADIMRVTQFLSLLTSPEIEDYDGRAGALQLNHLKECWLHITDQCNLSCRHCLFSCSAKTQTTLSLESIKTVVSDAYGLGTRVFYLTGGEPLVHPDFQQICRLVLFDFPDTMLAILTNGILLPEQRSFLQSLPSDRLFLQVSLDGLEDVNDDLRGKGSFAKIVNGLTALDGLGLQTTLSMAVTPDNRHQMTDMVSLAARHNINSVHYMWLLNTGRASGLSYVPADALFSDLVQSHALAKKNNVTIDNISNLSAQVFSTPGTRYDLGNAGWESLAIGPNGSVYPTPALIGRKDTVCGHISENLENVWRNSPALASLRELSIVSDTNYNANPLKYIIGGGDIDHSYYAGGAYVGHDPYVPLYNRLALWLMVQSAQIVEERPWPQIRRKMGEKLLHCIQEGEGVALTHSNCVLTFSGTRGVVGEFYSTAAEDENTDITNPVCYPDAEMPHIPPAARIRSYGCGSPVLDAAIKPGETVVDLGSGAGVECYIAARKVGPKGSVTGIDMLDNMLALARRPMDEVADNLGYRNVEFKKGFLEQLPVSDKTVDVVISNCVINLSEDKRRTFSEIFRVLTPGGRIFISDVVTDTPCPPAIQNDAKLRGECIAGALVQPHLIAILESAGFCHIRIVKRFFYKEVLGHHFYSVTYTAFRPMPEEKSPAMYPGPYAAVVTDDGELLLRGQVSEINWPYDAQGDSAIFKLDAMGNVDNIEAANACSCGIPPEGAVSCDCSVPPEDSRSAGDKPAPVTALFMNNDPKHSRDCMLCGKPLIYFSEDRQETCVFCGNKLMANAACEDGHFVCDSCHGSDMVDIVKHVCTHTDLVDMIDLINQLRRHPAFSVHGPEHHFAVPGVITATYKNLGGDLTEKDIVTAIERGRAVPGGACGFWGTCGAAVGVGIAFGIILKSNPLAPGPRQIIQKVSEAIISRLNRTEAARCCQREVWTALKAAAELSETYLPLPLKADGDVQCRQQGRNRECIQKDCPYFKI